MGRRYFLAVASIVIVAALCGPGAPRRAAAQTNHPDTVILDCHSVWHVFPVLKPPMIQYPDAPRPFDIPYRWVAKETPMPDDTWNQPDFLDDTWLRGDATAGPASPFTANLFLRASFQVTDPAQVRGLKLSIAYHGGVIVWLNGRELGRGNVAKDAAGPDILAEPYPVSAFVNEQGVLSVGGRKTEQVRQRQCQLAIPAQNLLKGVNLLAIEIIRAPYDKTVVDYWPLHAREDRREYKILPYDFNWYTCELRDLSLTAPGTDAIIPNASRPTGVQLWNSNLLTHDTPNDFADRCQPVKPIRIQGPRNGWSSGKVVIGSANAIEGLKALCSDLQQGSEVIPASAIRTRYAVGFKEASWPQPRLECLLETPLKTFPVSETAGAVVPIWVTVKVPASAKPGTYTGTLTIELARHDPMTVPVRLEVADFAVPDPADYRTWIELMQSPDTLAAEYHVPLWSDQHFKLINDSMRYIGEIGSRVLHVPLIAQTNEGNEQSMVRWIKKSDGTYDYDFSIMDRYLDIARKTMGNPKYVVFTAWEVYLNTPQKEVKLTPLDQAKKDFDPGSQEKSWQAARWDLRGKGPAVTALDPNTGEISSVNLPRFEDPSAPRIWKPLFDELHRRMAARGLENTMLLGMASDECPNRQEMKVLEQVSGNLHWVDQAHGALGSSLAGIGRVAYQSYVWYTIYPHDPDEGRYHGWMQTEQHTEFRRFGLLNDWPLAALKELPEIEITGNQRGIGRIGADFWAPIRDKRGERRRYVWDKYPQSAWHNCNLASHLLDPGPDGPVATSRYEMMREGVQECEARIAIERVLLNPQAAAQLAPQLAAQAQQLLDDRVREELKAFTNLQLTGHMYVTKPDYYGVFYSAGGEAGSAWYAASGWQDRTQQLYQLAGEVTQKQPVNAAK